MFKYTAQYTRRNAGFGVSLSAQVHKHRIHTIDTGVSFQSNTKAKECEENIQNLMNTYKQLKRGR
jgi:hypothetical protein